MHSNHPHRRAHQIRRCDIVTLRPGLAKAVIMPVMLRNQNDRSGDSKASRVAFNQGGKTLTGGVQWSFKKLRPGLARPLLVATQATDKAEKEAARAEGHSEAAPVMTPKASPKALAKAAAKAKPLSGWWQR